jgi:subtilisin family serine protease
VDTGLDYNHPDISANVWTNTGEVAGNGIDDDGNGYVDDVYGWDFQSSDNDPMDDNGHGSHLAGTIAGEGNNSAGVAGVNWTAKVMALKFLDANGLGDVADAASAIEYASAKGAHVVNCSFGGSNSSQTLKDVIDASSALFVCAAGNDGLDNDIVPHFPSGFDSENMLSVAASDQNDSLASFANFGATTVDVAAPGTNILSTIPAPRSTEYSDDFEDGDISDWTADPSGSWIVEDGDLSDGSGDYDNDTEKSIRQELPLSGELGCSLIYNITTDLERGFDFLFVESSTDLGNWTTLFAHTGIASGDNLISLPSSGSGSLHIRFRLTSDGSITGDGVQIEYVTAQCASTSYNGSVEYDYIDGSSMSAAVASGVAGLIKALYPSLTAVDIKNLILNSADDLSSLEDRVLSEGRINAGNAFISAPGGLSAQTVSDDQIDLSWTDNTSSETGYAIERRISSTGFSEVARVGVDATSYSDTGLSAGVTYTYRARAVTGTGASPYSNEATATTDRKDDGGGGGGGGFCFIATAAYGGYSSPEVKTLREFRDRYLITNHAGESFVRLYYRYSPPLAEYISGHPGARLAARAALAPVVFGARHPAIGGAAALLPVAVGIILFRRYRRKRTRKGNSK